MAVPEAKGALAGITKAIADRGGNIVSLVTFGKRENERLVMIKTNDLIAMR